MIEFIIIFGILFFIAVLFYKQANEQFEILQIDAARIDELPTMYGDRSPIVIKGYDTPSLGTEAELQKRPNIMQMAVRPGMSLKGLLASPQSLAAFQFRPETASFLAQESGLTVWFQHHMYEKFLPSPYTRWLYSSRCSLWPHHRGLFKTTAFQTLIMPTQGVARVSLMLGKVVPYLPVKWQGRAFNSLTPQDTPLLGQIKFLEVRLKKGNLLLLPAHMIVDIGSEENSWIFIAEIHHPISRLAG
jgi:hypothetical protein